MLQKSIFTHIASYRQVDNGTGMFHNPYDDSEEDRVMADSLERLEKCGLNRFKPVTSKQKRAPHVT